MIGIALVADGFGVHVPKGYLHAAMAFSVFVELIDMAQRRRSRPVHLRNPYGPEPVEPVDERPVLERAGMPGAGVGDAAR